MTMISIAGKWPRRLYQLRDELVAQLVDSANNWVGKNLYGRSVQRAFPTLCSKRGATTPVRPVTN